MVNVTRRSGERDAAAVTVRAARRIVRVLLLVASALALLCPLNAGAQDVGGAEAERQFSLTGQLGVRLVEDQRAAALIGVELRAFDETDWSGSHDDVRVSERHAFAPVGAVFTVGDEGEVRDYRVRTMPAAWLRTERSDARQALMMKGFFEFTLGRERALDRELTVDVAAVRSMLDLWERNTHVTIDARLLGWRHVRFMSDDGVYNGARLFQLGLRLGQRIGGEAPVWVEPFLAVEADTSLGALRERRFTTDVLVDATAGVHVAFGRHVSWESGLSYRGVRNRIRPTTVGAWRADSVLEVTF